MNVKNVQELIKSGTNKQILNLKEPNNEGLVLQIQHVIQDAKNKTNVVRFVQGAYNSEGTVLAAADQDGNVFLFDFVRTKAWCLPKVQSCSVLKFSNYNDCEILIGLNNGSMRILNVENGAETARLNGHKHAVQELSFAHASPLCISSSAYESIIWNLELYAKVQVLTLEDENALKHVKFLPVTDDILACFGDDTIYVWKRDTLKTFKQISPNAWNKQAIKTIAFTRNGRAMVLGGYSGSLYVFLIETWSFAQTVVLPKFVQSIKTLSFVSQPFDGGSNRILCILASSGFVYFFDMERSKIVSNLPLDQPFTKFVCSNDGKRICCVCTTGEIKVFNLCPYVNNVEEGVLKEGVDDLPVERVSKPVSIKPRKSSSSSLIKQKMYEVLDLDKLSNVLKEFGQYPDSFRVQIWIRILNLPHNKEQYNAFVNYSAPARVLEEIDEKYTLENKCMQNSLKRLVSNLVAWCPFFGSVDFLPQFVFPFLSVFGNDPLVCFEAVCTILMDVSFSVNWCQHWFEYFPLPPLNVLALIENLLLEHDPELLNHLTTMEVTSKIYALPLLQTTFSEVLNASDWCILWDNILTNEPSFFLTTVAAYSILNRNVLASLKTFNDYKFFYRHPNPIDFKKLLSKSYALLNTTMQHNHPRQYLHYFKKLEPGPYPKYIDYPKNVSEYGGSLASLKTEERKVKDNEKKLLEIQKEQEKFLQEDLMKRGEEIKRTEELQQLYFEKLKEEHDRILRERERISELRNAVFKQQVLMLSSANAENTQDNNSDRQMRIADLLNDLERSAGLNKSQLGESERGLLQQYAELLKHKLKIDVLLKEDIGSYDKRDVMERHQREISSELLKVQQCPNSTWHLKRLNIVTGLNALDKLIKKIERELKKTSSSRVNVKPVEGRNKEIVTLEVETKELEMEVKNLLHKLEDLHFVPNKNVTIRGRTYFEDEDGKIPPLNTPYSEINCDNI